jgi:hypothetical protein
MRDACSVEEPLVVPLPLDHGKFNTHVCSPPLVSATS